MAKPPDRITIELADAQGLKVGPGEQFLLANGVRISNPTNGTVYVQVFEEVDQLSPEQFAAATEHLTRDEVKEVLRPEPTPPASNPFYRE